MQVHPGFTDNDLLDIIRKLRLLKVELNIKILLV